MESLEQKTRLYYRDGKQEIPIDYKIRRITYGRESKERHIIYYSNYQLIAESFKEVAQLLKELIVKWMK